MNTRQQQRKSSPLLAFCWYVSQPALTYDGVRSLLNRAHFSWGNSEYFIIIHSNSIPHCAFHRRSRKLIDWDGDRDPGKVTYIYINPQMKWGEWELETVWRREWLMADYNTLWLFSYTLATHKYKCFIDAKSSTTQHIHTHTQANTVSYVWLWQSIVVVVDGKKTEMKFQCFASFIFAYFNCLLLLSSSS